MTDISDAERKLLALLGACDEVVSLGKTVEPEAQAVLIVHANANIYDQTPGAYQRTQALLRGLRASGTGKRDVATITLSSSVPYAIAVELGRLGMTPEILFKLAVARGVKTRPLTLGRTGRNYKVAGPILTPAAVFAATRMQDLFAQRVRAVTQ